MPTLKATLKSLDGLADPLKEYYKKEGEEFHLDVEGNTQLKDKLDEFRTNNRELVRELTETKEKLKAYDGVDLKKWKELQDTDQKVRDGELIKAGKIEELVSSKLDPILKRHAEQDAEKNKIIEGQKAQISRIMIDQELTKLAHAKKLRPEAIPDMLGRLRGDFTVVGDKVVALESDGSMRRNDQGDPYTLEHSIEGLIKTAPHLFLPSNGSGAPPNGQHQPSGTVVTRAEFNKMPADLQMQKAKEARDGKIKIVDTVSA